MVSGDGFLRIFNIKDERYKYHSRNIYVFYLLARSSLAHLLFFVEGDELTEIFRLVVAFKSYYGGFLCVSWTPDSSFVIVRGSLVLHFVKES